MAVVITSGNGFALYKGMKLPNIDSVWTDKETYKYALILVHDEPGDIYYRRELWIVSEQPYIREYSGLHQVMTDGLYKCYYLTDGVWTEEWSGSSGTIVYETQYDNDECVWSNVDIVDYPGSVISSAFVPISLDGMTIIEWDGDTTGLEHFLTENRSYYRVTDYAEANNATAVWRANQNTSRYDQVGDTFTKSDGGWNVSKDGRSLAIAFTNEAALEPGYNGGIYAWGSPREDARPCVTLIAYTPFGDDSSITSVTVNPSLVTMHPGESRNFEAQVVGTGNYDSSVDWNVSFDPRYGTPTVTQDGQLSLPIDMRPCTMFVYATSQQDSSKVGIAEINVELKNVYPETSAPAGGDGTYGAGEGTGYTSSGVPLGSNTFEHANTTMATMYALTGTKLNDFGEWLWSTNFNDAITKAQVEFLYGKVSDGVISLVSYPFGITKDSTGECLIANEANFARVDNITFYKLESEFSANILQSSDAQIDWGTLNIAEYWGSFLDYSPYTTIELYLPWSTGFVPINVNEVMGKPLSVKTNVELATGSCVHNIISADECIASYSGQVGVPIPLTSSDLSNKLLKIGASAAIMAVGGAVAGAAVATGVSAAYSHGANYLQRAIAGKTPFIPGKANRIINQDIRRAHAHGEAIINEAADIAVPIAQAAARQATNITRNGSFSADTASMTIQYPYLVISRPDISVPENYGNFYGYPSNIASMLKDLTGYTEVANIHLENVNATADELVLLEKTLKGGVIL